VLLITTNSSVFGSEQTVRDVGFVTKHMIYTDGLSFEIVVGANFLVQSPTFNVNDNMLQFNFETSLEEDNIAEIIIPRDLIDGEFTVLLNGEEISYHFSDTTKTSVFSIAFDGKGKHTFDIIATSYLGNNLNKSNGGGCLIATSTFGSEMAPQVQQLRELRDNTVLQTESGSAFMTGFNQFYYSFSPAIADYERENPTFKETVKLIITPLLISLTLLQYVDIDSESEILGYGIGIILLNIGMYFIAPVILIMKIRKRVNIEKLHDRYV